MKYLLNRRALERLKALVRSGKFTSKPWTFTADDSNALLGAGNWVDYGGWMLGIDQTAQKRTKNRYAYPYGKGRRVNLNALQQIVADATAAGDKQIADVAQAILDDAESRIADRANAARSRQGESIELTGTVDVKAAAGSDGNPAGTPTFSMHAYNGGKLRLEEWEFPVVVDLEGMRDIDKPRPALRDHDIGRIVGHIDRIEISESELSASGLVSGAGEDAREVVATSKKQFPWQCSVGVRVLRNQFVPEGESALANGRTWSGPVNIARESTLGEISFVALGADDDTSATIAAKAAGKRLDMKFKAWAKARGLKIDGMDDEQMKCAKALYASMNPGSDPNDESDDPDNAESSASDDDSPGEDEPDAEDEDTDSESEEDDTDEDDDESDDEDDAEAESDSKDGKKKKKVKARATAMTIRATAVRELCLSTAGEIKRINRVRKIAKDHPTIQAKAVQKGWSSTKTELAVLRASRPQAHQHGEFSINTGKGRGPITGDIIAAAGAVSAGVAEKYALSELSDRDKEIATSPALRYQTIRSVCDIVARAHGVHLPPGGMSNDVIRSMLHIERTIPGMDIQADGGAGGPATISLSGITQNIMNKAMLQAYAAFPSVVPDIAYETDTSDFKMFDRYRMTASGDYKQVPASGELKEMSLQDETYSNQLNTYGMVINLGRQLLMNDDMGAITQTPTIIGRKGALARERSMFTAIVAMPTTAATGQSPNQPAIGFNFFSAGAKNYLTGGGSALGVSGVTNAVQTFIQQKDANGDPIMLVADRMLLPPALQVTGQTLFDGANLIATGIPTGAKNVDPSVNAHRSKYRPIASPYLGTQSPVAGSTDTGWYLLPDPSGGFAIVQVGYLRGQRTPSIERGEPNFNQLGLAMRSFWDYGVAPADWRCGVFSAGA